MKPIILTLFLFTIAFSDATAQENMDYENMQTFVIYPLGCAQSCSSGNSEYYLVNGHATTREEYEYVTELLDQHLEFPYPHLVKELDIKDDALMREYVAFSDCIFGYYKEYYSNGELKVDGQHLGYPKDEWSDISNIPCQVKDGEWKHYDRKGKLEYVEKWQEGDFISQEPPQKDIEIWNLKIFINNEEVDTSIPSAHTISDLENLTLLPLYKNHERSKKIEVIMKDFRSGYTMSQRLIDFNNLEYRNRVIENIGDIADLSFSLELNGELLCSKTIHLEN